MQSVHLQEAQVVCLLEEADWHSEQKSLIKSQCISTYLKMHTLLLELLALKGAYQCKKCLKNLFKEYLLKIRIC